MAGLVENFIRRVEKIISSAPTVPPPGTNHVDDNWLNTDIYPGEIAVRFSEGTLYTTDGESIIDLNREDVILGGMILEKDTSGTNKLTVTSGSVRINGVEYTHTSSGTDIFLPYNTGSDPILYFVYAEAGASGAVQLSYTSATGTTAPGGIYTDIVGATAYPTPPSNAVLLGSSLVYVGGGGFSLAPRSVSLLGDYYPKFSLTPSEFLRSFVHRVDDFDVDTLYFPGQFLVYDASDAIYLAKSLFVSDSSTLSADISAGNVVPLGGSGGGGGGSYNGTNTGSGLGVFNGLIGSVFQFRTIRAAVGSPIQVTYTGAGNNTIQIGLTSTGILLSAANVGTGATVFKSTTTGVASFRSLTAGTNVTITPSGDNIVISVPAVGSTTVGINLGAGASADIYAGMSGDDLTFRRLIGTTAISISQGTNAITISTTGRNNQGTNVGSGPVQVYAGMVGDNLTFKSLTGGANVTVTELSNTIIISASGGSGGSSSYGTNVGATGTTAGQIFKGMSGSDELLFRSLVSVNPAIQISTSGDNILIDSTLLDGAQGPQGPSASNGTQGAQGPQGFQGFQGNPGPTGLSGTNGNQGPQGFLGPQGNQGNFGPQGPVGPERAIPYIELYDNSGGWTISSGSPQFVSFNTLRYGDSMFTVSQTANGANGTSITITDIGTYIFIYTVTILTPTNVRSSYVLRNISSGTDVPGSRMVANDDATSAVVSVTAKATVTVSTTTTFGIRGAIESGTSVSGQANGSSLTVLKMVSSQGVTGSTGPDGPTGPTGASGPTMYITPAPGATNSAGSAGEYAVGPGLFYFHDGSQWWSLTGNSF
jgi:hypothetical protein